MTFSWPLVERAREFQTISDALTTTSSAVSGVVLIGDAGVGKTTLARFATQSHEGATVHWTAGTESARRVPLGAFAHLFGHSTLSDPVAFLSAAREALVSGGPIVLGVDDAHLLDQLSATLLLQLAIDRSAQIVATIRDGEQVPDAITSLWKDGHLTRLHLRPFTRAQSIDLIETALGGKLEGLSADLMWESSCGNPLFLRHLIEAALESGALRPVRDVWQLRGKTGVTPELASLLKDRVAALPENIRRALQLLSLCEPMDIAVLSALAGEEAVEESENRGLMRVAEDGEQLNARFTHPLFGEVIRRGLGVAASRRLRGEIVTAMRRAPSLTRTDAMRLAELALGSDQAADAALLVDAARIAIGLSDTALGERFARAAVERGGGFEAADLLARALLWQGRPAEVEETLAAFPPDELDDIALLRWGASRISNSYFSLGDPAAGDQVLTLLRARLSHPGLVAVVEGIASACSHHQNRLDDAVDAATTVLGRQDVPAWAVAWAAFGAARSLALMGRGTEVDDIADRLRAAGSRIDGLLRYPAAYGEIQALAFTGRLTRAQQRAAEYLDFSSSGQYLAWGLSNTMCGFVEVACGKISAAIERLEPAVAALLSDSVAAWIYPARIALAEAYAAVGRADDARQTLADAWQRFGAHLAVFEPQLRVAEAWVAAAENASRAVDLAHVAAESAAKTHQHAIEAEALHAAARFGDRTVGERLGELAESVDGQLVPLYARHAAAMADSDAAQLDRCAHDFEQLGALLSAADAAAEAAVLHQNDGNQKLSAASAAVAHRIAALCGGVRTPALREVPDPLSLTVREREIATLIAAGLSNTQIAERLYVSIRTVEGHVYRACSRLNLADRGQLGALVVGRSSD